MGLVQLASRDNPYLGGGAGGSNAFSEQTARIVDAEIRRIIGDSYDQACRLLTEHRSALDSLVRALLERETLDEKEILEVTGLPPAPLLASGRVAAASR